MTRAYVGLSRSLHYQMGGSVYSNDASRLLGKVEGRRRTKAQVSAILFEARDVQLEHHQYRCIKSSKSLNSPMIYPTILTDQTNDLQITSVQTTHKTFPTDTTILGSQRKHLVEANAAGKHGISVHKTNPEAMVIRDDPLFRAIRLSNASRLKSPGEPIVNICFCCSAIVPTGDSLRCPSSWDGISCWPSVAAGVTVSRSCKLLFETMDDAQHSLYAQYGAGKFPRNISIWTKGRRNRR